jgi:hypothetical protein
MTSYYYMLITSLPRHSRQYKIKQTPISRIQLEKRLKLLTESERNILKNLINCLWDSWFDPKLPFQVTITKSKMLLALNIPFINELIHWFFDIRSVFVALRLRKTESKPPANPQACWSTQWNTRLIKNWDMPDFGLKSIYPWLTVVSSKLSSQDRAPSKGDTGQAFVEDSLLTLIWKHLDSIEARHFYDFEALIIYLMRWNIVNYWSQFNEKIASDRIRELADTVHLTLSNKGSLS